MYKFGVRYKIFYLNFRIDVGSLLFLILRFFVFLIWDNGKFLSDF